MTGPPGAIMGNTFQVNSAPMNRTLYTLLFHLGLPLVAIRLWLRARKAPAYARRIG